MDVGLAKNTNPNAPLPSNGPLSHNPASTTLPRTNRQSAKRKGEKNETKKESSECSGVWRNGREKKKEERRIKKEKRMGKRVEEKFSGKKKGKKEEENGITIFSQYFYNKS